MSHSRQPLVKGQRLVRYEVNTVMMEVVQWAQTPSVCLVVHAPSMHMQVKPSSNTLVHAWTYIHIFTQVYHMMIFTQRVCCTWQSAMPGQHSRVLEQAQSSISPRKIVVTCKSPVGDISAVTLIRTDTTLDHSQKAEKVCVVLAAGPST